VKHVPHDGGAGDEVGVEVDIALLLARLNVDDAEVVVAAGDEGVFPGDGRRAVDAVAGLELPVERAVGRLDAVEEAVVRAEDDLAGNDGGRAGDFPVRLDGRLLLARAAFDGGEGPFFVAAVDGVGGDRGGRLEAGGERLGVRVVDGAIAPDLVPRFLVQAEELAAERGDVDVVADD